MSPAYNITHRTCVSVSLPFLHSSLQIYCTYNRISLCLFIYFNKRQPNENMLKPYDFNTYPYPSYYFETLISTVERIKPKVSNEDYYYSHYSSETINMWYVRCIERETSSKALFWSNHPPSTPAMLREQFLCPKSSKKHELAESTGRLLHLIVMWRIKVKVDIKTNSLLHDLNVQVHTPNQEAALNVCF